VPGLPLTGFEIDPPDAHALVLEQIRSPIGPSFLSVVIWKTHSAVRREKLRMWLGAHDSVVSSSTMAPFIEE